MVPSGGAAAAIFVRAQRAAAGMNEVAVNGAREAVYQLNRGGRGGCT